MAGRRSNPRSRGRRGGRSKSFAKDKDDKLYMDAEVEKALPNTRFLVNWDNGMQVMAHLAGKLRRFRIRVLPGDRVSVEVSAYDPTKGRITFRHRGGQAPPPPSY